MDKKTPRKKKPANKSTTRKKAAPRKTKTTTARTSSRRTTKPKVEKIVIESTVKVTKAKAKKAEAKKKPAAKRQTSVRKKSNRTNNTQGTNIKTKPVEQKKVVQKSAPIHVEAVQEKANVIHKPNHSNNHHNNNSNSNNSNNKSNTAPAKKSNSSFTATQKPTNNDSTVTINQNVAILVDGNNIEKSIHSLFNRKSAMLDFDNIIPKLLRNRGLNRLIYFREGLHISSKLAERLHKNYFGTVVPCHKSADIPLSITATQLAEKVDTIIILSGDSDYVDLVRHLRSRGVRVEIAAIKMTTAKILIDEADFFTEITKTDCYVR